LSLRERVEALFNKKCQIMSEIWETEHNSPKWYEMSRRHKDIVRELSDLVKGQPPGPVPRRRVYY